MFSISISCYIYICIYIPEIYIYIYVYISEIYVYICIYISEIYVYKYHINFLSSLCVYIYVYIYMYIYLEKNKKDFVLPKKKKRLAWRNEMIEKKNG